MSESKLKKEFAQKDVKRLRNLIQGKGGAKTTIAAGYQKDKVERKEGDVWEEDGRKWTIKNGIKQNISKLQKARELNKTPLFCPECNEVMNHRYDKEFYTINKRCFDCQVEFETKLKISGEWEEYQKQIHNSEIDNTIQNYEIWVEDLINSSNDGFISETGELEKWSKANNSNIVKQKEEAIKYLENLKKK
jgi:hypothetical protein